MHLLSYILLDLLRVDIKKRANMPAYGGGVDKIENYVECSETHNSTKIFFMSESSSKTHFVCGSVGLSVSFSEF